MQRLDKEESESPIRKYLPGAFEELKDLKSMFGTTMADIFNAGFENPHSEKLAVYVGDHDCYNIFATVLDPIIRDYHGIPEDEDFKQPETDFGDPTTLKNLDPDGKFIKTTKIRVSRNIEEYAFLPKMSEEDYATVMERVMTFFFSIDFYLFPTRARGENCAEVIFQHFFIEKL